MATIIEFPWVAYTGNQTPTADFVKANGVILCTGNYTYYGLATRPCKVFWSYSGYNRYLYFVTPYDSVKFFLASGNSVTVTNDSQKKGTSEQLWTYGGLDGYYRNYTYLFNLTQVTGISYGDGNTSLNSDILYDSHEDSGHSYPSMESRSNDDNWNWASVDEYSGHSGTIPNGDVILEPETSDEPKPEPQDGETGVYVTVTVVQENPYSPGGESGESDGGGEFELENSPIPLPDLPTLNIINTGFVKAYNPTLPELAAFQSWLWTDNPFENVWRSVLGNPYDYIIGLKAMPVEPVTGTAQQVTLGNVTTPSTLTMKPVTEQYKRHNFGTVNFREYSKSFLDYAPYTRVSLYLPYIGFVQIDADIINNKAVNIQYSIDMLSGAIMAFVIVDGKTLYAFSGSMGLDVPTTNQSYNNILSGIVGVVGGVAAMGAAAFTGGLAVPMGISGLANAAAGVISATKPTLEHGNGLSGVPGVMGNRYPYFIIKRPKQSIPDNIQQFTGFPSNILKSLSDVSGFTKVEFVHLENISASDAEKAEIMELLQEGVIF